MTGSDSRRQLIDADEGYALVVDMPGFERDEIDVSVEGGMLTILATRETMDADLGDEESSLVRAAGRSRRAHERVRLPEGVSVEGITATYRNGVLEIQLPTESDRSRSGVDIPVRE